MNINPNLFYCKINVLNYLSNLTKKLIALCYLIQFLIAELHYKTGVDLDIEIGARYVAALPDGQAAIMIKKNLTIVRVNKQGVIVNNLYDGSGSDIRGLLVQGSHLFVLHYNRTIVQIQPEDGHIVKVYNTGIID